MIENIAPWFIGQLEAQNIFLKNYTESQKYLLP